MDLSDAPACEFEVIRRRMKATHPHMVVAQHDEDSLSDEAHANQGGYCFV